MRAIVCGANGAMGKLICGSLGDEVVGRVSIDGEKVTDVKATVTEEALKAGVLIKRGKKSFVKFVI